MSKFNPDFTRRDRSTNMMRIGKRSLCKLGIAVVTLVLIVLAVSSMTSQKKSLVTAEKPIESRVHRIASDAVAKTIPRFGGRTRDARRKAVGAMLPRRKGLEQKEYPFRNASWVIRSRLSPSKHNISLGFTRNSSARVRQGVEAGGRSGGPGGGAGNKAAKRNNEIRQVLENLRRKKEQKKAEVIQLISQGKSPGLCLSQGNVAYIKTHKTASTTLQTVINRYGLLNKQSFVLNKISPTNGHFVYIPVTKHSPRFFFLPPLGVRAGNFSQYQYNMIAVHLRYNRTAMDSFMLPGTRYISIIREPSAHFESAFTHFRFTDSFSLATRCRVKGHEIEEFMRKPGYYRKRLKKLPWDTARGLRWYYARNNQIFDLGLDSKYHENEAVVNRTVDTLAQELDLVLISEYFDESLVLLKKLLCWSFDDIVYISKNQRLSRVDLNDDTRRKIREWSRADTILYQRFNATLWRKIRDYGPEFEHDLATFRRRKDEVFERCVRNETIRAHGQFKHKEFTPSRNSSLFCTLAAESKTRLFHRVWMRQAGAWNSKLRASRNRAKTLQVKAGQLKAADTKRLNMQLAPKQQKTGPRLTIVGEEKRVGIEGKVLKPTLKASEVKHDECQNVAPETDLDFESSDGNNLVFPEEI